MFDPHEKKRLVLLCLLYYLFDPLARVFGNKAKKTNIKKNILIVRTDHVGDFILWLDAAKELRLLYPNQDHHITLLANSQWADLAKMYPYWDEIIALDVSKFTWNWLYHWHFLKSVSLQEFDVILNPLFIRLFWVGDSIVRIARAPIKIGWFFYKDSHSPFLFLIQRILTKNWYSRYVKLEEQKLSQLQMNAYFMRALGLKDFKSSLPCVMVPDLPLPQEIKNDYIVIAPDASWEGRQWPLDRFLEVARRLFELKHWNIVILGTNQQLSNIIKQTSTNYPLVNLIGQTTITEFVRIIAGSRMVIGNDSAAIHVASGVDISTYCIAGGGHWGRFVPYLTDDNASNKLTVINRFMECYNCFWVCKYPRPQGAVKCIQDITIDDVWNTISKDL